MLELIVSRLTAEAEGVVGIELRSAHGLPLPPFTAGAHIDLHLPGGMARQYSLCNDPRETHRYCLGVGLAAASRGGSAYLHQQLREGDKVAVSAPRSLFGIDSSATEHLFIAGGIGITPILSMIHWCEANQAVWRLLYCVRSRQRAAYAGLLSRYGERVTVHADDEHSGATADLAGLLGDHATGAHVYCCGPVPLMDAVADAAARAGIHKASAHFERFNAAPAPLPPNGDKSFVVKFRRSGVSFVVPPDASILQTLEQHGMAWPFSCREGLCRTCEVPLLSGTADHRDSVLSDDERAANTCLIVCVSRARSDELELDM